MELEVPTAILLGGIMGGIISFLTNRYTQERSFSANKTLQEQSYGKGVEKMVLETVHKLNIEYYHSIIQAAWTFSSDRAKEDLKFSFHWLGILLSRVRKFRDSVGPFYLKDQTAESVLIYLYDSIEDQIPLTEEEKNTLIAEVGLSKDHREFWEKLRNEPLIDLLKKFESWGEENQTELRNKIDAFWRFFITELRWEFYAPWRGEMISHLREEDIDLIKKTVGKMQERGIINIGKEKEFLDRLNEIISF